MLMIVWLSPGFLSFMPIFLGWYTTQENLDYLRHHPSVSDTSFSTFIVLSRLVCMGAGLTINLVQLFSLLTEMRIPCEHVVRVDKFVRQLLDPRHCDDNHVL